MKRFLIIVLFFLSVTIAKAQPVFDIGLKAGVTTSSLSIDNISSLLDLDSDAITNMHWGAFGRVGFGRLYVQPELYFNKKGGDLTSNIYEMAGGFDYKNIDVPVLLGYKVIKGSLLDLRLMAGPVFSFVTDVDYPDELDDFLHDEFFNDHLLGVQYGVGVDVLFLTLDARMEHCGNIYEDPDLISGRATSFMITLGFKIL